MGTKISALPAASALSGTEAVPLVQSATTKQATVAQIATAAGTVLKNFTAAGAGAVARTFLSKDRDVVDILDYFTNTSPGVTDATAAFNAALLTFAQYSVPANPTFGGTAAANCGGVLNLTALNFPISSTINVPIQCAIRGLYTYHMGQAEAQFFGSGLNGSVAAGPILHLQNGAVDGVRLYKQSASMFEGVRIIGEFCQVTNCLFDTHDTGINFYNETANVDPVFAWIAHNSFTHQNDATKASIVQTTSGAGTDAMAGALIEFNNFNVGAASGYAGVTSIKMDGTHSGSITIRKNIFQNYAVLANAVAVDLYGNATVEDNDWSMSSSASGQTALRIGGANCLVQGNRFSNFTNGIRCLASLTNSVIGPNLFSGNTTDIIIDAGCAGNIFILTSASTVITDNNPGQNLFIKSWLKTPQILAASAAGITAPADTTLDTLVTVAVPGGILGPNGEIRVECCWSFTNNANSKTVAVSYGGSAFRSVALASIAGAQDQVRIINRNNVAAQYGATQMAKDDSTIISQTSGITGAVNSAVSQNLVIAQQKATAGDTVKLESYLITIIPG